MSATVRDVVITGLGPVTSIGVGCDALWSSLQSSQKKIEMRELHVDVARTVTLPIAAMPGHEEVPGLNKHFSYLTQQECEGYRDLAYSLLAVELALDDAQLEIDPDQNDVGSVQVFEAPGVESAVSKLFQLMSMPLPPNQPPQVYDLLSPNFYNMQPFLFVHLLSKAFGMKGFSTSVHNACSSGAFAFEVAAQRIQSGQSDVMVVVGGEAFDTAVRLEWFRRLELYARDAVMRPFDATQTGFFVGEGAGALVMESADHAAKRGAHVYAKYLGGAFAHQGWKQTIPDVRSARLKNVIGDALKHAKVSAESLDFIVPHGTATRLSDGYESKCVEAALDGKASQAIATAFKPAIGHMLAASGVIEMVCSLLSMKNDTVCSTFSSESDDLQFPVPIATTNETRPLTTMMKLFTGFTGHDAALIFQKP